MAPLQLSQLRRHGSADAAIGSTQIAGAGDDRQEDGEAGSMTGIVGRLAFTLEGEVGPAVSVRSSTVTSTLTVRQASSLPRARVCRRDAVRWYAVTECWALPRALCTNGEPDNNEQPRTATHGSTGEQSPSASPLRQFISRLADTHLTTEATSVEWTALRAKASCRDTRSDTVGATAALLEITEPLWHILTHAPLRSLTITSAVEVASPDAASDSSLASPSRVGVFRLKLTDPRLTRFEAADMVAIFLHNAPAEVEQLARTFGYQLGDTIQLTATPTSVGPTAQAKRSNTRLPSQHRAQSAQL